jgi:hypothetical protein
VAPGGYTRIHIKNAAIVEIAREILSFFSFLDIIKPIPVIKPIAPHAGKM